LSIPILRRLSAGAGSCGFGEGRRFLGSARESGVREPKFIVVTRHWQGCSERIVLKMDVVELEPVAGRNFGRFLIRACQADGEDGRHRAKASLYVFEKS
jgi:hypothetical protein